MASGLVSQRLGIENNDGNPRGKAFRLFTAWWGILERCPGRPSLCISSTEEDGVRDIIAPFPNPLTLMSDVSMHGMDKLYDAKEVWESTGGGSEAFR